MHSPYPVVNVPGSHSEQGLTLSLRLRDGDLVGQAFKLRGVLVALHLDGEAGPVAAVEGVDAGKVKCDSFELWTNITWMPYRLKSLVNQLYVQQLIQAD